MSPIFDPLLPLNGNRILWPPQREESASATSSTTAQDILPTRDSSHSTNQEERGTQTECETSGEKQSLQHQDGYLSEDDGQCDLIRLIPPSEPPLPMVWYPEDVPIVALVKKVNKMTDLVKRCQTLLEEPISLLKFNLSFARDRDEQISLFRELAESKILNHYESVSLGLDEIKKDIKLLNRSAQSTPLQSKTGASEVTSKHDKKLIKEGVKYNIHLNSKKLRPLDPIRFFNEAIKGSEIHLNGTNVNGLNAKLTFSTETEQQQALALLETHKVDIHSASQLYEIKATKSSEHVVRTEPFGKATLLKLPFQERGSLNVPEAIKALVARNKAWFHGLEDIVDVQMHQVNEGKGGYAINIHLTKTALERVRAGIKDGIKLDLTVKPVNVHEPVRRDTCFKCHEAGHTVGTCNSQYRCKSCPLIHKKDKCLNLGKPVCYRCYEHNAGLGRTQEHLKLPENHQANSATCPALGLRRNKVRVHQDDRTVKRARRQ